MDEVIEKVKLPTTVNKFVKIPKEVILSDMLSEHRLSVLIYLNYNQTWDKTVHYSPLYMIQWSGYKPNWDRHNKNNIYIKFKNCMQWFFENGYLIDFNEDKYIQSNFQSSLLNIEKIQPMNNFGLIYDFEIELINNFKSSYKPLNRSLLLLLLSYIRAFTWNRSNQLLYYKPEIFHSQFQTMSTFIGISRKLISRATEILELMGLIKTYRMPKYKDTNDNWHTDDIIYVCPYKYIVKNNQIYKCSDNEYNAEEELKKGIEFLKTQKNNLKKSS